VINYNKKYENRAAKRYMHLVVRKIQQMKAFKGKKAYFFPELVIFTVFLYKLQSSTCRIS
jgi:hypothetical protein